MKVVYALHSHGAGGAERHLVYLMRGLRDRGVECVFGGPTDSWLAEELENDGFWCVHIPYHGFFDLGSCIRLARTAKLVGANIIHGHLTRGANYAGWAGRLSHVASVATAHSTNAGKHFGRVDRIIAVSDAVRQFLLGCGYSPDRVCRVYHGVPDRQKESLINGQVELSHQFGLVDKPIIAIVARVIRDKGHDIALKALALLKERPWTLVVAGSLDTPWAKEVLQLSGTLGISERVHFVGHLDDVRVLYGVADLLLAPSRREALSLTLLEAAAYELPVVATNVGGIGEAVADQQSGLLVDPEDPVQLAEAIATLLDQPELAAHMGRMARQRYEQLFTIDAMVTATLETYREILGRTTA